MLKETTVITFWTFDILHLGHIFFLEEAKKYGTKLITIVARDENVIKLKNQAPLNDENIRLQNIKNLWISSKVQLGDKKNPLFWLEYYHPDIICLWYDQEWFLNFANQFIIEQNIKIKRLPALREDIYKSSLLRKIKN